VAGGVIHESKLDDLLPPAKNSMKKLASAEAEEAKLPKRSNKRKYDDQSTLKGRNFVSERY
jgi:hypothetical protein